MKSPSQLREYFHALPNSLNCISVGAFVYSDHLKKNVDKLSPEIKDEILKRVITIDEYVTRAGMELKEISGILGQANATKDCESFIGAIDSKLSSFKTIVHELKKINSTIHQDSLKADVPKISAQLDKLPDECQAISELLRKLKTKLIDIGKYE